MLTSSVEPSAARATLVEPPLTVRRIAIVGYAETSWPSESVWADPTIEKWTLNHGHSIDPRWDRLFEFHGRDVIDLESREHFRGVDQWEILKSVTCRPIYMKSVEPDVPCSVAFPLERFIAFFGRGCVKLLRRPYVEMAAGYMLGYAAMLLYQSRDEKHSPSEQIDIYGFELFDGEEYEHQRACFEFYAGFALGLGIKLNVPETSAIFSGRGLYEYDTGERHAQLNQADTYLRERFKELTAAFRAARERNEQATAEMQTISGSMQEVEQQQKFVTHLLRGGRYQGS